MRMDHLKKHVIDTIKEWQMKIGYQPGDMKLYYPEKSLLELLGFERNIGESKLCEALFAFCTAVEPELGKIQVSNVNERYCLDIPAKGCEYVAEKIPEPIFLRRFISVITNPGSTLKEVKDCFFEYARENAAKCVEVHKTEDHVGHVFYFDQDEIDGYVYCVEEDEFGLTYHRFTKSEYKEMVSFH